MDRSTLSEFDSNTNYTSFNHIQSRANLNPVPVFKHLIFPKQSDSKSSTPNTFNDDNRADDEFDNKNEFIESIIENAPSNISSQARDSKKGEGKTKGFFKIKPMLFDELTRTEMLFWKYKHNYSEHLLFENAKNQYGLMFLKLIS